MTCNPNLEDVYLHHTTLVVSKKRPEHSNTALRRDLQFFKEKFKLDTGHDPILKITVDKMYCRDFCGSWSATSEEFRRFLQDANDSFGDDANYHEFGPDGWPQSCDDWISDGEYLSFYHGKLGINLHTNKI